jgi:hypothetical protein
MKARAVGYIADQAVACIRVRVVVFILVRGAVSIQDQAAEFIQVLRIRMGTKALGARALPAPSVETG